MRHRNREPDDRTLRRHLDVGIGLFIHIIESGHSPYPVTWLCRHHSQFWCGSLSYSPSWAYTGTTMAGPCRGGCSWKNSNITIGDRYTLYCLRCGMHKAVACELRQVLEARTVTAKGGVLRNGANAPAPSGTSECRNGPMTALAPPACGNSMGATTSIEGYRRPSWPRTRSLPASFYMCETDKTHHSARLRRDAQARSPASRSQWRKEHDCAIRLEPRQEVAPSVFTLQTHRHYSGFAPCQDCGRRADAGRVWRPYRHGNAGHRLRPADVRPGKREDWILMTKDEIALGLALMLFFFGWGPLLVNVISLPAGSTIVYLHMFVVASITLLVALFMPWSRYAKRLGKMLEGRK